MVAEGLTTREIADLLIVSRSTVRSHLEFARQGLGTRNLREAVAYMGRRGWVGWKRPEDETPLSIEHPFLAAYVREFERSRWPHEPAASTELGMRLALAGHRNTLRSTSPQKEGA